MRLSVFAALVAAALPLAVQATGTVQVQQPDGSRQIYEKVTIRVVERTLQVTLANRIGTLVISDAACSYVNQLMRCLPEKVVLKQNGTQQLDFDRGIVYYNPTSSPQSLTFSSQRLKPGGVLATLESPKGTFVSITGTIDGRAQ
jgi:hypothetical protein